MAILGRGQPAKAIIVSGQGVTVSGIPQTTVVAAPVDRRYKRVNAAVVLQGPAEPVAGPTVVVAAPIFRARLRITGPIVTQGSAEPVPGPIVVSTPRNPKVLAPRPIIITALAEPSAAPGSPPLGPYVLSGPNPHRTTKPAILVSAAVGIIPPVTPADVEWCAQSPVTGWTAQTPFTDWVTDTPLTNWMSITPEEDC